MAGEMRIDRSKIHSPISDAATNTTVDCYIAEHYTTAAPAANFGAAMLYRAARTASGALEDIARVASVWTDVGAGTEASAVAFQLRRAGGALAEQYRLGSTTGLQISLGGAAYTSTYSGVNVSTATNAVFSATSSAAGEYAGFIGHNAAGRSLLGFSWGSGVGGNRLGIAAANNATLEASAGALSVGTVGAQALTFATGNTGRWQVSSSGHLLAFADATYDIGASGATRPRNLYLGGPASIVMNSAGVAGYAATNNSASGTTNNTFLNNLGNAFYFGIRGSTYGGTVLGVSNNKLSFVFAADDAMAIGTGAAFALTLGTNNTARWQVSSSGHLLAFTDNTYDIGASGATRPRTGYFGTSLIVGGVTTVATDITINNGVGTLNAAVIDRNDGAQLRLTGRFAAAGAGPDVQIYSTNTRTAGSILQVTNTLVGAGLLTVNFNRTIMGQSFQPAKGADVVAANDLPLLLDGDLFHVTGTTQINGLPGSTHATAPRQAGSRVTLIFDDTPTVKHNTAPSATWAKILLAGSVDFAAAANSRLVLEYDGTSWYETARTVA